MYSAKVIEASNGKQYIESKLHRLRRVYGITYDTIKIVSMTKIQSILKNTIYKNKTIKEFKLTCKKALKQDLRNPILIDPDNHILNGDLKIIKVLITNKDNIKVWKFKTWDEMNDAIYELGSLKAKVHKSNFLPMEISNNTFHYENIMQ